MKTLLKIDLNKVTGENRPVVLDIGCGRNKRPGAIDIDRADLPGATGADLFNKSYGRDFLSVIPKCKAEIVANPQRTDGNLRMGYVETV